MGWPSAPFRRGPDGLEFWLQGTMLKVAPVSTKYLTFVNSSVKKIKPAFAGKCIAVAMACVEKAAETKGVRRRISFPTKNRANAPVTPIDVVVVKFAHALARVLKRVEIWAGRGVTFFCCLSSCCWEQGFCFAVSRRLRPWGHGRPERPIGRPQPSQ
jgi:hypothetical protein